MGFAVVLAAGLEGAAAEYVVSTTADSGPGSLRAAIAEANAAPGEDVIRATAEGTIALVSALPAVTDHTVIDGPGAGRLRLSGGGVLPVLAFGEGTTNRVSGLTIAEGYATNGVHGAGIANAGSLQLVDCVVSGNRNLGGWGGGLFNRGDLALIGCHVVSNSVTGSAGGPGGPGGPFGLSGSGGGGGGLGGGLYSAGGWVVISNSVLEANSAEGGPGGGMEATTGAGGAGGQPGGGAGGAIGQPGRPGRLGGGGGGGGAGFPLNRGAASEFGGGSGATSGAAAGSGYGGGGGGGGGLGGAVCATGGRLRLERSRLIGNRAAGGPSGGVYAGGNGGSGFGGALFANATQVEIADCWLRDNTCLGGAASGGHVSGQGGVAGGGAVLLREGTAAITGSTFSDNSVDAGTTGYGSRGGPSDPPAAWGGGLGLLGGTIAFTNCTISGNLVRGAPGLPIGDGAVGGAVWGGGLYALSNRVTLVHCTLATNHAIGGTGGFSWPPKPVGPVGPASAGGFFISGATVMLQNTLAVGNAVQHERIPSDGSGTLVSLGGNLLGTSTNVVGLSATDLVGVDARLGSLADRGGPTPTHGLEPGSAALDAAHSQGAPAVDQRGFPRPVGAGYDIGAFERAPDAPAHTMIRLDGKPVLGSVPNLGPVWVSMESSFERGTVLYTLDGSVPTFDATPYREPFLLTQDARIRAFAYDGSFAATTPVVWLDVIVLPDPRLGLALTWEGEGHVSAAPSGDRHQPGAVVRLTAVPVEGWRFAGWSGDVSGTDPVREVRMDGPRTVQALFVPVAAFSLQIQRRVTVPGASAVPYGPGVVDLDPPGGIYASNTLVKLTARVHRIPFERGYTGFKEWRGDAQGTDPTITLKMDRPRSVEAVFEFIGMSPGAYWFEKAAVGGGSVAAYPSTGFDIHPWQYPLPVRAVPESGWSFLHWTGDLSGTTPTNLLRIVADSYVEGVFGTAVRTVVSGGGRIEMSPRRTLYPGESTVRLLGVPAEGYAFALWGNAASGTHNPTELTIREAEPTVSALFVPLPEGQAALTVGATGFGTVRTVPAGNRFPIGTQVQLTAEPGPGQDFVEWSGDASGREPSLLVTLDRSRWVRARFTLRPRLSLMEVFDYRTPGSMRVRIEGEDGAWYAMERSVDLRSWERWSVVTNRGGASVVSSPPQVTAPFFYRAVRIGP